MERGASTILAREPAAESSAFGAGRGLVPLPPGRGLTAATPSNSSTLAYYVDVGGPAGLAARTIIQGHESKDFLLATTGGGIAAFDYDNDGWPDIYVADDSTPSLLLLNQHGSTFRETGLLAGVAFDANDRTQAGMGVGDYDGDGRLDIIKTNFSDEAPALFHNEGNGFFTDVTYEAGLGGLTAAVKWGTALLDFDNDGNPDLLIVTGPIYPPGSGASHPMNKEEGKRVLLRNPRNGRFEDVSDRCGPGFLTAHCSRGAAVADIFRTGQLDIVVNNINDSPTLLRNQQPSANKWLLVKLAGVKTNRLAIGSRVVLEAAGHRQMREVRSGGSFCSEEETLRCEPSSYAAAFNLALAYRGAGRLPAAMGQLDPVALGARASQGTVSTAFSFAR